MITVKNYDISRFETGKWEKWKMSVDLNIISKNITYDVQNQAFFLHKGSMLSDIFFSLPNHGNVS
jgi:hypothetical protein